MNTKEIRERMSALGTELDGLIKLDALTEEQDQRVDAIVDEINDLGEKLARATNAEAAARQAGEAAEHVRRQSQSRGTVAGILPREDRDHRGQDGDDPRDFRAALRSFHTGDDMELLRRNNGKGMAGFDVGSFWDMRAMLDGHGAPDQRTLLGTDDLSSSYLQPQRIPGIQRGADAFGSLRDVLNVGITSSDSIVFFRETSFTNNAAPVAEATATSDTSGTKAESALAFEEATANVKTIAHWIPITRQLLWNAPEFESYVSGRLVDGLRLEENDQVLNGDGTGQNLTGILETTGIQLLDNTTTTGYWAVNPVDGAGTDTENMERILRARTLVATEGRARANFVILNPVDHEAFLATKDGQSRYFGQGPFSGAPIPTLWGMQVVENENIAEGNALVGDGRQATIWDRMAATVTTGTIDKQFIRNMLTLLAEERIALTVFRPKAFAHVQLVGATPPA